jgi:hypothetical protein
LAPYQIMPTTIWVKPSATGGSRLRGARLGPGVDPKYCDVVCRRWQSFTGKAATLEGDGRRFEEIAAEWLPAA